MFRLLLLLSIYSLQQLADSTVITNLHLSDTNGETGTGNRRQKRETGSLLRTAVQGITVENCHLQQVAEQAITFAIGLGAGLPSGMTGDECAAIWLYTAKCLDSAMNHHLENNDDAGQFQLYVDLLRTALTKLPVQHGTVWRGASVNFSAYVVGERVTWSAFTSTTADRSAAIDFIKYTGGNALFEIKNSQAYDIAEFSKSPTEHNILLSSNIVFMVSSVESASIETYKKCVLDQLTSASSDFTLSMAFHIPKTIVASVLLIVICYS